MEGHGHDAVRGIKSLLHAVSVVNINVDVQHSLVIPRRRTESNYCVSSEQKPAEQMGGERGIAAKPRAAELPASSLSGADQQTSCGEQPRALVSNGTQPQRKMKWLLLLRLLFEGRLSPVYSESAKRLHFYTQASH